MSRPYMLKEYDQRKGHMVLVDAEERRAALDLQVNRKTKFLTQQGDAIKTGTAVYCNTARLDSERTVTQLFDATAFEARRKKRLQQQQNELTKNGLTGTVMEVDRANHRIEVMIRRADSWYARLLKENDSVGMIGRTYEKTPCKVVSVH